MTDYPITPLNNALKKTVSIRGHNYPVYIDGKGPLICFSVGIGNLTSKSMSAEFKKQFTVYSSDLYWVQENELSDPTLLTIDMMVDDLLSMIDQLNISNIILLGHSCFGMTVLEMAKRHHHAIAGVIMIGTPTEYNPSMMQRAADHFNNNASIERQENDHTRKKHYDEIKTEGESEISLNAYASMSARYWADFTISTEFLENLWDGIHASDPICNHFWGDILHVFDLKPGMEKINVPVIHFTGQYDYDCIPMILWKDFPKPSNLTTIECMDAGHWPQLECASFFDEHVKQWTLNNKLA
jgi:pimeloyl-ACP methyl ester carboxylesterase